MEGIELQQKSGKEIAAVIKRSGIDKRSSALRKKRTHSTKESLTNAGNA